MLNRLWRGYLCSAYLGGKKIPKLCDSLWTREGSLRHDSNYVSCQIGYEQVVRLRKFLEGVPPSFNTSHCTVGFYSVVIECYCLHAEEARISIVNSSVNEKGHEYLQNGQHPKERDQEYAPDKIEVTIDCKSQQETNNIEANSDHLRFASTSHNLHHFQMIGRRDFVLKLHKAMVIAPHPKLSSKSVGTNVTSKCPLGLSSVTGMFAVSEPLTAP